jgi:homoserine kinase type II
MRELGAMTARMHLAAAGCKATRQNALSLQGWKALVEKLGDTPERIEPGLSAMLRKELEYLEAHWPKDLPAGVIHADLFPDNVFFQEKAGNAALSGVIDFYFACNDFFMYDLAICMNAWSFEGSHDEFNITRAGQMLKAYHAVRPITHNEMEALPVLARGAALRFLLTRAYDWLNPAEGALVRPKNPMEYVHKLRFHQRVKTHGEYGL